MRLRWLWRRRLQLKKWCHMSTVVVRRRPVCVPSLIVIKSPWLRCAAKCLSLQPLRRNFWQRCGILAVITIWDESAGRDGDAWSC